MAAGQYPDSGVSSREIYGFRPATPLRWRSLAAMLGT